MSACHNLRLHFSLKTVLGRLGDTYQTYCNTYKTHAMATNHGGSGQPLDRVTNTPREEIPVVDTDVELQQDFCPEDTDQFESLEHNNPNRLHVIIRELDDLCQRIQVEEGWPTESLHHTEQELEWLSISLNPPTHTDKLQKFLAPRYLYRDGTRYHTARRLVSRYRNCSWSNNGKQNKTGSRQVWKLNSYLNHRSYHIRKILGGYEKIIVIKICNSNIHMSICHFMEIQQKEKVSLAVYIHHFKREAKRCNFTNNTATIRIFVKGLKDTHMLATRIYEKGLQTLIDAMSEVKKLQATQQLTATLIPSSTVNIMSNEEDHCFSSRKQDT